MRFTKPRRLAEQDALEEFLSGESAIDAWLHTRAKKAARNGTAITYVSHTQDGHLAGFYSISANSVKRDEIHGGWLARNTPDQIPVILLGMLAVDQSAQGHGLGWMLLQDALNRSLSISGQVGARAVIVDPLTPDVERFYEHFGFRHIPDSRRMYLKLV